MEIEQPFELDPDSFVSSITGTANQVLANGTSGTPQTGDVTLTLPQDIATNSTPTFTGLKTGKIYPTANSTTALQILKADGTTNILNFDTTNGRVGVGLTDPQGVFEVALANTYITVFNTLNSVHIEPYRDTGRTSVLYLRGQIGQAILQMSGQDGQTGLYVDNLGKIGAGTIPAVNFHTLATTEQLRAGYDASNYLSVTIGSSANATFNLVAGAGTPVFTFADGVNIGSTTQISLGVTGAAVFNEQGADADFRIEGDTNTNLFFVDASTDRIGVNTSAPSAKFHLIHTAEQLRVGYDTSNYLKLTVASSGSATIDMEAGSGTPKLTVSDDFQVDGVTVLGGTQSNMPTTGTAFLTGSNPGGNIPGMVLYNSGGGADASVSIDFFNTNDHGDIPQAQIKTIDDGNYSDHIDFLTKEPGAASNALVQRVRVTSTGDLEVLGNANGLILKSPDDTRWRITVSDLGVISATAV